MTREELGTRVRAIISDHLARFRRDLEVTDESKLLDGGLKLDSLDLVEITMELEDQFDLEIADDELDAVGTVGELITFLAGKLGIASPPKSAFTKEQTDAADELLFGADIDAAAEA